MVRGQLAGHRDDEFHGAKRFPRSEHLKMTERFTPVSPGIVEWRVTFDDPHTWTRPWTFTWTFTMMLKQKTQGEQVYEYAWHEVKYGLKNILTGARANADVQHESKQETMSRAVRPGATL